MDEDGFDYMKVSFLRDLKAQHRSLRFVLGNHYLLNCIFCYFSMSLLINGTCRDYSKTYARAKYYDEAKPWNERCDVAFPCASQNEIDQSDAINLVNSGCRLLVEGSVLNVRFGSLDLFFIIIILVLISCLSCYYIVTVLHFVSQVPICPARLKQLMF